MVQNHKNHWIINKISIIYYTLIRYIKDQISTCLNFVCAWLKNYSFISLDFAKKQ